MRDSLKQHTILYAEDDEALQESTSEYLRRYFREVYAASDGEEALALYRKKQPSAIILDIDMPKRDGLQVAKDIRETNSKIPILMLTAFTDIDKLLEATELNLCKYLVKPVEAQVFKEALHKLSEVLKEHMDVYINLSKDYKWDSQDEILLHKTNPIALSHKEKILLALLVKHHKRCVSFEEIMATVWEDNFHEEISVQSVKLQVTLLRKKLPKESIKNVYGKGYVLN